MSEEHFNEGIIVQEAIRDLLTHREYIKQTSQKLYRLVEEYRQSELKWFRSKPKTQYVIDMLKLLGDDKDERERC